MTIDAAVQFHVMGYTEQPKSSSPAHLVAYEKRASDIQYDCCIGQVDQMDTVDSYPEESVAGDHSDKSGSYLELAASEECSDGSCYVADGFVG